MYDVLDTRTHMVNHVLFGPVMFCPFRRAMLYISAACVVRCLSVCLSVFLASVTFVYAYCVEACKHVFKLFNRRVAMHTILVFPCQTLA